MGDCQNFFVAVFEYVYSGFTFTYVLPAVPKKIQSSGFMIYNTKFKKRNKEKSVREKRILNDNDDDDDERVKGTAFIVSKGCAIH